MGIIERRIVDNAIKIKDVDITFLSVPTKKAVTVFVFESNGKKAVYAPCDCKNFPADSILYEADLLIIGNTFIGNLLKNNTEIYDDHPLRKELHSVEDVLEIKNKFNIKEIVVTHIEETWGKILDDYKKPEKISAHKIRV